MEEVVYSGTLTQDELKKLISACEFGSEAYLLAEQLPVKIISLARARSNLLRFTSLEDDPPFADFGTGRIFGERGELRWEQQGKEFHIVYIGVADNVPSLRDYKLRELDEKTLPSYSRLEKHERTTQYFLFGERLRADKLNGLRSVAREGDFAEVRIPRILRYPTSNKSDRYALLKVREYVDPDTNKVELFRFLGLATTERKEQ